VCTENVVISPNKNNIVIRGVATDGTDGVEGTFSIAGAQNISFENLTVRNASTASFNSGNGITVSGAGTVSLYEVTVRNNSRIGVGVFDHSFLTMNHSQITLNGRQGINAVGGSRVTVFGSDITNNDREGVSLFHASSLSIAVSGSTTSKINDNKREGIRAQLGSSVFVAGFSRGDIDIDIEIKNNGSDGNREALDLSASTAQIDDVTISGSFGRPVIMSDGSILRVFDSVIESDIADVPGGSTGGILVNRGSILTLGGNNTVSNVAAAPGGTAISVANASSFRSSRTGTRDEDEISSTNGRALNISSSSLGDLRNFELKGLMRIVNQSTGRLRKDTIGVVYGDIEVARDSVISFVPTQEGSVQVTGTVTCADTESSADLADQSAADIVGGNGKNLDCSGYGPANSKP
jgi:hypothetical protein